MKIKPSLWFLIILGIMLVLFYNTMQNTNTVIKDRKPRLFVNLKTNGVLNGNTNDVTSRKNFQMQPLGNNYS